MGNIVPMIGLAVILGFYFHFYVEVFEPKSVAGKRVLITGASTGVGEQLAYQYSKLGARVFITADEAKTLENVAKKCQELGAQKVQFITSNLSEKLDLDKLMAEVSGRFGGLDILILSHAVTSSGLWVGTTANISTLTSELKQNFVSSVELVSRALPALTTSKGSIGVVSTLASKIPVAKLGSYTADEFALHGFLAALRVELQHLNTGVSVTACVLGPVDTDPTEARRKVGQSVFLGLGGTVAAEDAAEAIVTGIATHQREVYHGKVAWILVTLHQIFPGLIESRIGDRLF